MVVARVRVLMATGGCVNLLCIGVGFRERLFLYNSVYKVWCECVLRNIRVGVVGKFDDGGVCVEGGSVYC